MSWKEQDNLRRLKKIYLKYPLVLYTGAGISYGDNKYGLPGWKTLLLNVAKMATSEDTLLYRQHEFDGLWPETWLCADWVTKLCDGDSSDEQRNRMENYLFEIIQKAHNYRIPHKQLNPELLRVGTTLTSITAFCCDLGEVVEAKQLTYECYPNRRIQGIITTNYDPFLEAAAATMFRKELLKPVAAYGAPAGTHQQIPVFHIHGYVPHPGQQDAYYREPTTSRLVITSEDYNLAWAKNTAFGTTITPQVHYLRHFPTLFIGFSFDDKEVVGLLKKLQMEREYRKEETVEHFAIMNEAEANKLDFAELGIKVIELPSFIDIPACLGEVYQAGLEQDFQNSLLEKLQMDSIDDYWSILLSCRNAHPQKQDKAKWVQRFKKTR